ncbi:hypothetical protein K1719_007548 [Acacia pycnantha]|nr:hypothetical protein K1719_007548 [Acacia pycnantha]
MLQLAHEIIKPPPLDMVPMEIRDNPKHFPYFKDCIGAIDAGWEGSANDCRVFNIALETPRLEFPHPPPGKFYVVDFGYPTRDVHNFIRDHQVADKNLAHYANPNIAAATHTSAAINDEGPSDQVTEINIIKKNIANQLARDNQLPPI